MKLRRVESSGLVSVLEQIRKESKAKIASINTDIKIDDIAEIVDEDIMTIKAVEFEDFVNTSQQSLDDFLK